MADLTKFKTFSFKIVDHPVSPSAIVEATFVDPKAKLEDEWASIRSEIVANATFATATAKPPTEALTATLAPTRSMQGTLVFAKPVKVAQPAPAPSAPIPAPAQIPS